MFLDLVNSLTPEQRKELENRGIATTRVSEWRAGKTLPNRTHTIALHQVTGADFDALSRELAYLEAVRDSAKNPKYLPTAKMFAKEWHFSSLVKRLRGKLSKQADRES